jgi:peptidoglycan/xylan/chitin deacetylase (PgdA/CDA1 family)
MILEAGHSIGNHTQTHPKFSFWCAGPKGLVREIDEFESTLSSFGVPAPIWFRAPAGIKNLFLHPILAARGLRMVAWSARAFDTRIDDPEKIVNRIKRSIRSGSIILFHEAQRPDVCLKALDKLLKELTSERYKPIVPKPVELFDARHSIFSKVLERSSSRLS